MIVVFAGPTISHSEVAEHLDCVCLPPVSHGDIIKLMSDPPKAIGIIDGYFEGAPSVWHKEILYALDQGIHVFGASSMGALRSAELDVFGMRGVGQIYEWYRDSVIEDDDEVAVLHGPAEVGYTVASEPMVSIRMSLAKALSDAVIEQSVHDELVVLAKKTFYKKRSWRALLTAGEEAADADSLRRLGHWLSDNAVDLKKRDAVLMLETMAASVHSFDTPFETDFHFEWTHVWDKAFHSLKNYGAGSGALSKVDQRVLDEVRLDVERFKKLRDSALLSWLVENPVDTSIELADTRKALSGFREENGFATRAQLLSFMDANELDEDGLTRIMENRARLAKAAAVTESTPGVLERLMIDKLKIDGRYGGLKLIVEKKSDAGVYEESAAGRWEVLRPQLVHWYFGRRCGVGIPESLGRYVEMIGLDVDEFYTLIGADFLYSKTDGQS